jgi:phosphate transport system ATP-binding protein
MTSIVEFRNFSAWYGGTRSLQEITLSIPPHQILGVIGPAGGGKTTLLRSLNRMNDFDPRFRCEGDVMYHGVDLYRQPVDVAVLRRKMGMVFAVPVPLPGSILENLELGPKLDGRGGGLDGRIETCLKSAYLWDEVKDRLNLAAQSLSGGQQQRLCLARSLMLQPDVLLLDEPCSGLDPISTAKIEEALQELKKDLTVVLVTNNVMQASRVADRTAFFLQGKLIEAGATQQIFVNPKEKLTHDYISGRFG